MHDRSRSTLPWIAAALCPAALAVAAGAWAQDGPPRISALFPAGAKAGDTVEVAVKGGNLVGVKRIVVIGAPGVSGEVVGGGGEVDQTAKPLFQAKCTTCHEARSPSNRSMSAEQWASTVDRMITQRGADIPKPERDKIVSYLQALTRSGEVTAKFTVAKDAAPGMREVRLVAAGGASSAFHFEVSPIPTEVTAKGDTQSQAEAQKLTMPVVVNGILSKSGQRDFFSFDAKQGQRLTFNLKGFRLNEPSQTFFNPAVYLYDASGKEVARARGGGKFGLDPVLDWTAPTDGAYTLVVRDLLFKGSPSSVYRLAAGEMPADPVLTPAAGRPGETVSTRMVAASLATPPADVTVQVPSGSVSGVTTVPTPMGDAPFLIRDLPDGGAPALSPVSATAVALPALFRGVIGSTGAANTYKVKAQKGGSGLEVYASRLGSPLRPKVTVRNAKGDVVAARTTDAYSESDFRMERAFPEPGEYTVEIADAEGRGGPSFAYCWDALDAGTDFALSASPDVVNLAPGASTTLLVRASRRDNLAGPIAITLGNLPTGVTAAPAFLPPDDDKVVVVLSAAPTATGDLASLVSVEGTASALRRVARPVEALRIGGNTRLQPRGSQMVAVAADAPPFSITLEAPPTLALAKDEEAAVKVKITRDPGFKGEVILSVAPLPPNVGVKSGYVPIPPDKTEAEVVFRANGNARFFKKDADPNLPPLTVVITARPAGADETVVTTCTPPIALSAK